MMLDAEWGADQLSPVLTFMQSQEEEEHMIILFVNYIIISGFYVFLWLKICF